ncbi:MAG: class II aldolase/adducin family protein, partial [Betaproteobacteria bacterium]|nr:class II aldolase/adducin family protein [Betaproteobacteria bacterium]
MQSLWNNEEAAGYAGDLAQRVYTSRLLGRDKSLVQHGGGNTSVRLRERNLVGDEEEILYVKGSGQDLEFIEEAGFAPVRLAHVLRLAQLKTLSDPQLVNELQTHLTRAASPAPSVETILHALLPHKYVDHTHSGAVLAVTNTVDGEKRIAEIYGDQVVVIPYVMPGFNLARLCAELIQLVDRAERYLARHNAWSLEHAVSSAGEPPLRAEIAALRLRISHCAGNPMVMTTHKDARIASFVQRTDIATVSQQGPVTPDHVIRTKRLPMLGRDVEAYAQAYRAYFGQYAPHAKETKSMLDAAPRVVLDASLGMCAAGRSTHDAAIVSDLYRQTMDVIERATRLGG